MLSGLSFMARGGVRRPAVDPDLIAGRGADGPTEHGPESGDLAGGGARRRHRRRLRVVHPQRDAVLAAPWREPGNGLSAGADVHRSSGGIHRPDAVPGRRHLGVFSNQVPG
ncbi:hypothetical protein D3C80_936460 [compost metagenome]